MLPAGRQRTHGVQMSGRHAIVPADVSGVGVQSRNAAECTPVDGSRIHNGIPRSGRNSGGFFDCRFDLVG